MGSSVSWLESYGEKMFGAFDMSKLLVDQAYLNVTNRAVRKLRLDSVYVECYGCPYTEDSVKLINATNIVSTHHAKSYRVVGEDGKNVLCTVDPRFGEFGVYDLQVADDGCSVSVLKDPVNIYFPILTVALIYLALLLIAASVLTVWKVYSKKNERDTTSDDEFLRTKGAPSKRLKALDVFRGISIVFMLFANFGCGGYSILDHAVWNGLQFSDVVFPWFVWIMGACIPMSARSWRKSGSPKQKILVTIFQKSCIMFALGMFLASGKYLERLRIFGVLQRLAVSYLFTAAAFVVFSSDDASSKQDRQGKFQKMFLDVCSMKFQWLFALLLVALHSALAFGLPVPDCPTGYLGPGGLHDNAEHEKCTAGAAGYIDDLILGKHIYGGNSIKTIYHSRSFDPEGILGCLTSIVQAIIGAQAGVTILIYREDKSRLLRWLAWGVVTGLLGGILCGFGKEDGFIPINKNLWSLSFVLATSGLAFVVLAACYYMIDVSCCWTGKPFLFAGMNSMLMYLGHSVVFHNFPIRWTPSSVGFRTHLIQLSENVWATGFWIVVAYCLYRKKYFFKL